MLGDEEFSGLVPLPSTEHYQPQLSRHTHRTVIELDVSSLDLPSKVDKISFDKSTLAKSLERDRPSEFAAISHDLSFQKSPSDIMQGDINDKRHLSTDHYSPAFTRGHSGRTKLRSEDLNVPEVIPVSKEGTCTKVSISTVDQEKTAYKNAKMPCFTDDLFSSKPESTDQDQSVQVFKTNEKTTSLVEIKSEDKTIDRMDKISPRETASAESKFLEDNSIASTLDKFAIENQAFSGVDKLAEKKLMFAAADKLEKLAKEKPTFAAVDKLAEEKPTFAAVDKLAEEKPTFAAVDKLAEEKSTFAAVDKLAEEKSTFAAVDKLAEEKPTFASVDKLAEENPTFAAVDKLAEENPTFAAVDKLAEEKPTFAAVDKLAEENPTFATVDKLAEENPTFATVDKLAEEKLMFAAADNLAKLAKEKPTCPVIEKLAEEKSKVTVADKLAAEKTTFVAVDKLTEEKPTFTAVEKLSEEKTTCAGVVMLAEEKATVQALDKLSEDKSIDVTVEKLQEERITVASAVKFDKEKLTIPAEEQLPKEETTLSYIDKFAKEKSSAPTAEKLEKKGLTVSTEQWSAGDKLSVITTGKIAEKENTEQAEGRLAQEAENSKESKPKEYKAAGHTEEKLSTGTEEKLAKGKEGPLKPAVAVSGDLKFQKSHSSERREKVSLGGAENTIDEADLHLDRNEATEESVSSVAYQNLGTGVNISETGKANAQVHSAEVSANGSKTALLFNREFIEENGDRKERESAPSSEARTEKQKKGKKGKKQGKGNDGKVDDLLLKQDEQSSGVPAKGSPLVAKSTEETKVKQQKKEKVTNKEKEKKTDQSSGHNGEGNAAFEKTTEQPVSKSEVSKKQKKGRGSKKQKVNELDIAEQMNEEKSLPSEESVTLEVPLHKHDHTCLMKGHVEKPISGKKDEQLKATETMKAAKKTVTIEDLSDNESDDHESVGDEEEQKAAAPDQSVKSLKGGDDILSPNVSRQRQSRSEKKARKALSKMGLKQVHGVTQITMKRTKNVMFTIENPDVFKNPGSETYIIFGEARIDDLEERSKSAAADKFRRTEAAEAAKVLQETKSEDLVVSEQPESEEELDEGGVEPNDIELVMSQAGVSRSKAIKALRDNKNDIVNAIMALTM